MSVFLLVVGSNGFPGLKYTINSRLKMRDIYSRFIIILELEGIARQVNF